MLGFRAKLNKDTELVNIISTRFVPVAVDHEVERRKDAEGELYRKVAGKAVSNSVLAFDPSGKLLFQRRRDRRGHGFRAGARIVDRDRDRREIDLRQRRDRQQIICADPEHEHPEHQQRGGDRPPDKRF